MAKLMIFCTFFASFIALLCPSNAAYKANVVQFGAKPDGQIDSTQPFLKAWASVCSSAQASTMYVPQGRFFVKAVVFRGPCKNKITVQIDGTIVSPGDYRGLGNSGNWILFIKVNRVSVVGGILDARGDAFWNCRTAGKNCPVGARVAHLAINGCNNAMVRDVKLNAPDQSPNTDEIHVESSTGVTITGSTIKTGDDCISIGPGTKNLLMERIQCGPGHGVRY